jgi:hypothetical protein
VTRKDIALALAFAIVGILATNAQALPHRVAAPSLNPRHRPDGTREQARTSDQRTVISVILRLIAMAKSARLFPMIGSADEDKQIHVPILGR